jgi:hypothetical protein
MHNAICSQGLMPENLNVALITPIPKKDCIANDPSTYRPISVSSFYALLFEYLIEKKMFLPTSINQMGFKHKSSTKKAYFVVNETIQIFDKSNSPLYVAALDAAKTFDRQWRIGLFYKLIGKID